MAGETTADASGRLSRGQDAAILLGVLALFAANLAVELHVPLKDDVAWLLHVASNWIDGHRLYVSLIELNPPPIIWLSALPVLLGRLFDISALQVMPVFTGLLMLGSAWWTAGLVVRRGLFAGRAAVFAAIAILLLFVPAGEFGQREQIIIAAALPYLALRLRPLRDRRVPAAEAAAAGALVALCCALKPWYAPAFLLVEAVMAMRGAGLQRAAILGAVAAAAVIGAAAVLAHPEYVTVILPLAMALYISPLELSRMLPVGALLLLTGQVVAACLWWLRRPGRDDGDAILILLLFAFGATLAYFEQGKGWFYHRIPATVATIGALLLWSALSRPLVRQWAQLAAIVLLLAFAGQAGKRFLPRIVMAADFSTGVEEELSELLHREGARSYLAFSSKLALGFPVVDMAGATWASRFPSMWAVQGELLAEAEAGGAMPRLVQARRWIIEDFLGACPDIVVVDRGEEDDFPAALGAVDPDFAHAWAGYAPIDTFGMLQAYRRMPGGAPCGPRPRSS
ncbi:hypothetical protein [Plastoroseomonas hellenica]|uniref:hypothetical protein n=1 Tax=Plastoroseomonas hellenica TaxID=2687306 RepID=UPI001BAD2E6E|nr:hypothetical protein [Plastoroseomonas hellenica]MBR0647674.1 hypothetical protein [Plastoroseomonas hellenica]